MATSGSRSHRLFLSLLVSMSLFHFGDTAKCYYCTDKYSEAEVIPYEHGPCWGGSLFSANSVDTINCGAGACITVKNERVDKANGVYVNTVFRGCAPHPWTPKNQCDDVPKIGRETRVVDCCYANYCNSPTYSAADTDFRSGSWLVASCLFFSYIFL